MSHKTCMPWKLHIYFTLHLEAVSVVPVSERDRCDIDVETEQEIAGITKLKRVDGKGAVSIDLVSFLCIDIVIGFIEPHVAVECLQPSQWDDAEQGS